MPNGITGPLADPQDPPLLAGGEFGAFEQEAPEPAERQPRAAGSRDNAVLRQLGEVLVLPAVDGVYKAPVMVLSGEVATVYSVIEKHFNPEVLNEKEEKFWRIIKAENSLDTWRPRIQGQQLRALQNVRLPETADEYERVRKAVAALQRYLRPTSSVEAFMDDLQQLVATVETWWENRNKRPDKGDGAQPARPRACRRLPAAQLPPVPMPMP
jgi:hypothetical protein